MLLQVLMSKESILKDTGLQVWVYVRDTKQSGPAEQCMYKALGGKEKERERIIQPGGKSLPNQKLLTLER